MSEKTIIIVKMSIIAVLAVGVISQFFMVMGLKADVDTSIEPIDYGSLEEAVTLWEQRKPFVLSGVQPLEPISTEEEGEDGEADTVVTISVLNGSGVGGAASDIAEQLGSVVGASVADLGNANNTAVTTVGVKASVDQEVADDILAIIEETYGEVSKSVLSENADFDVIITLGGDAT